jgi:hypothetical protein
MHIIDGCKWDNMNQNLVAMTKVRQIVFDYLKSDGNDH